MGHERLWGFDDLIGRGNQDSDGNNPETRPRNNGGNEVNSNHSSDSENDANQPNNGDRIGTGNRNDGADPFAARPRGGYSDYGNVVGGDQNRGLGARAEWSKESLPPLADNEVEFIVRDPLSYSVGQPTRSPTKTIGNFQMRLLIFPSGTQNTQGNQVSAFVEADPQESLDPRWVFQGVKYQVSVINWLDYRKTVTKTDTWTFSKDGIDRGWHDLVRTSDLTQAKGWLNEEGCLCFRASCYVKQADSINLGNDYNSKKETGYVGLKNHGATCYMNGLLQSLFHVGEFRRIVYSIDEDEKEGEAFKGDKVAEDESGEPRVGLIQALQNVFYKVQTSDQAVTCRELMKSFGWDTMDAFTQHDVQELNRILCDRLEEQMKGTPMDGSIKKLFEGEMENYIQCCDIDYKSTRNETFYDIQLNIKGERGQELGSIDESLQDFTAEEILEGDNAYEAEGYGKQRAKKGIKFKRFPPVLNLQLKRFHFDLEKMDMVKLNTRFEFGTRLDLSQFAPGAGTYALHAVVVHSGDVNSGHYYAHIKPTPDSGWMKFDDDTVTPCSEFAAVDDNFGGSDSMVWNYFDKSPKELHNAAPPVRPRIHNAYMLVYVREDVANDILRVPDPKETNFKMVDRCEAEVRMAETRKREKLEQQLKINVRLVLEKDLMKVQGFWDHTELPYTTTLKMSRDQNIKDLLAEVEKITEIPQTYLALFVLHYRTNPRQVRFAFRNPTQLSTLRRDIPSFSAPHFDPNDPYLVFLAVGSRGYDPLSFKWTPAKKDEQPDELSRWSDDQVILLVVKYFCPVNRKIFTLGCYYTSNQDPLIVMIEEKWVQQRLQRYIDSKESAPLPEEGTYIWECHEEFSERDIQQRNTKRTVKNEQLWSGDVIIWQPRPKEDETDDGPPLNAQEVIDEVADGVSEAPAYPVNTVADLAAHMTNAVDVTVTFHDCQQPLTIDGVVANGVWGPPRPTSAAKDERTGYDDALLSQSPCQFFMPVEKEFQMDLRWQLLHVTANLAKAFSLENGKNLWLFHSSPFSNPDEPWNSTANRTDYATLKEIQRSGLYNVHRSGKTPALHFHAVEVPSSLGRQLSPTESLVQERNICPVCVRFHDDAVREMGSTVVMVPLTGTIQDVINESKKVLKPDWGISQNGPFRIVEVCDSRLHKVHPPNAPVRSLMVFNKVNVFYHSVRLEIDPDGSIYPGEGKFVEFYHQDRNSNQAFGQPFLMAINAGEKSSSFKARVKQKLKVPEGEFKSWRFLKCSRQPMQPKTHLKDDDLWEVDVDTGVCIEHSHPNPSTNLARQSRYNKPLTIK